MQKYILNRKVRLIYSDFHGIPLTPNYLNGISIKYGFELV